MLFGLLCMPEWFFPLHAMLLGYDKSGLCLPKHFWRIYICFPVMLVFLKFIEDFTSLIFVYCSFFQRIDLAPSLIFAITAAFMEEFTSVSSFKLFAAIILRHCPFPILNYRPFLLQHFWSFLSDLFKNKAAAILLVWASPSLQQPLGQPYQSAFINHGMVPKSPRPCCC